MGEQNDYLANVVAKFLIDNPEQTPVFEEQLSKLSSEAADGIRKCIFSQNGGLSSTILTENSNTSSDTWTFRTMKDAYGPRPPIMYVVDGIIERPSLNIFYGPPGSLKSMVVADMCATVASGSNWLPPLPNHNFLTNGNFRTVQGVVVWIDFDNGRRRTDERFGAIGKAKNLDQDAPLYYISMPSPWLDASDENEMDLLAERLRKLQATLLVVDNLATVSGGRDENSSEMKHVMQHFRALAEECNLAVIIIHHARKTNGSNSGRLGDSLRGHSSIEGSIDLALSVKRLDDSQKIVLIPTKVRGAEVHKFAAEFAYDHKDGTKDLEKASFYGINSTDVVDDGKITPSEEGKTWNSLIETIINVIKMYKKINQSDLIKKVKLRHPDIGDGKIRQAISNAVAQGLISVNTGPRNAKEYTLDNFQAMEDF